MFFIINLVNYSHLQSLTGVENVNSNNLIVNPISVSILFSNDV